MADVSSIEWTDSTWNVLRGCTRVSPGCGGPGPHGGCYAEGIAARFSGPGQPFEGLAEMRGGKPRWTGKVAFAEHLLTLPLRWQRPRRIFVNSMSDLFHEDAPDEWIDRIFAVMALCPQHTFQVLTKRSARMRSYLTDTRSGEIIPGPCIPILKAAQAIRPTPHYTMADWPLPNVWLGVSAEDQRRADERVPDLLRTPASVRFMSAEPLLGPIDLDKDGAWNEDSGASYLRAWGRNDRLFHGLDWIIVGGESGREARPMHQRWARDIRDQCATAGVSFFFKQWGEWLPGTQYNDACAKADPNDAQSRFDCMDWNGEQFEEASSFWADETSEDAVFRVGKKRAGRLLDGVEHNGMPQVAAVPLAGAA